MRLKRGFLYVLSLNIGFIKNLETQREQEQKERFEKQPWMLTAGIRLLYYELFREEVKCY